LVYFLAIEITRRRLASTISFLARLALASPMDMARLISLMSGRDRNSVFSMAMSFSCSATISSLCARTPEDHFCFLRISSSAQSVLVSLPGKARRKSLRGTFACLMHRSMITRSCWRMLLTTSRSFFTRPAIMIAGSLSLRKASAICSRTFCAFLSPVPYLSAVFWNLA